MVIKMKISKYLYKKDYYVKVVIIMLIALIICLAGNLSGKYIFSVEINDPVEYHFKILTINSILSGFSLTNLGILISISGDQLVEKLKGTDILLKRNILISYSIIYGAISIFMSLLFVVNINISIPTIAKEYILNYFLILEMMTLFLSIIYFLLSVRKMIQLLSYIYIPKKIYTCDKIDAIRKQMDESVSETNDSDQ